MMKGINTGSIDLVLARVYYTNIPFRLSFILDTLATQNIILNKCMVYLTQEIGY